MSYGAICKGCGQLVDGSHDCPGPFMHSMESIRYVVCRINDPGMMIGATGNRFEGDDVEIDEIECAIMDREQAVESLESIDDEIKDQFCIRVVHIRIGETMAEMGSLK